MNNNFWQQLKKQKEQNGKPFFALAPMADVTDPAFRILIAKYGKPDVMWTEFVSANGLNSKGREALKRDLEYSEVERPIVAQLFSSDPHNMEAACKLCALLGFDGVDINMGCPDKTIEKQGSGAGMIKTPEVAREIIASAKRGIKASGRDIPLSVKTRVGYNYPDIKNWIGMLLEQKIQALTVHARTRKDLSKVPANWDYIKEVVSLRDKIAPDTVIIGNGDVVSLADGIKKASYSGADGVMVGRALFGNPWFFDPTREVVAVLPKRAPWILRKLPFIKKFFDTKRGAPVSKSKPITIQERLSVMIEHAEIFEQKLGDIKSFNILKKHMKAYVTGFDGAKDLRVKLMEKANNSKDVKEIVDEFLTK
ncbi:MAG TPA: tRNA-dihydrouridine synthase [Candidatus Paceibacterota bacterium]|nr:tRNA-dihydrouridine synthase [Candidatus Paceibacterota bacterium]